MSDTQSKPVPARVKRLVKRALREKQLGNKHHERGRAALVKARQCGLELNQPIELEIVNEADGSVQTATFEVVDNFTGEAAYRSTCIPRFELKKVPKFKRQREAEPQPAPTAEAGI